MRPQATFRAFLAALLVAAPGLSAAQKIPNSQSTRPRVGVDVTGRSEDIGDKIEAVFYNADMVATYLREEKIKDSLGGYLGEIGAKPKSGEVHVFYVQALVNETGNVVELKDFQYLTHAPTTVDAIRESFTLEGAPGTEDRIDAVLPGTRLEGVYVSAHPDGDGFIIRGGSLTPEFYQKIRKEGLDLRAKRVEERRIQDIRQKRATAHAASDANARAQLQRDLARGPLPPGPALFPSGSPVGPPTVYLPPTRSAQNIPATSPIPEQPVAHPRIRFDPPPPPQQPKTPQSSIGVDPLR